MLADSLPRLPSSRGFANLPKKPSTATAPGADKLLAVMPDDWYGQLYVRDVLNGLKQWEPDPCCTDALQHAWDELIWLRKAWETSRCRYGSSEAIDDAVGFMAEAIATRDNNRLLQTCELVRTWVSTHVQQRLSEASRQAQKNASPYAQEWIEACAGLFLSDDGSFDATVFPAVKKLLDEGAVGLMPASIREVGELRLRQLMEPRLGLPELVDRLSSIHPLHPDVDRLRQLQFGGSKASVRHQLASMVLQVLWTFPLQPDSMGICRLRTLNAAHHLGSPQRLLQSFAVWFECGHFECMSEDVSGNCIDEVKPVLFPVHAIEWAERPDAKWNAPGSRTLARLVKALDTVMPGFDDRYWQEALKGVGASLQGRKQVVTPMALLRGVLIRHLNATKNMALTEAMSRRRSDRLATDQQEQIAAFNQLLNDSLCVLERDTLNLLSAAWQLTTSRHAKQAKLCDGWRIVEEVLLDGLARNALPQGMYAYLDQIGAVYLSCADLRYERSRGACDTGLRLFLRTPGSPGRGTPVRSASQFREWLERYMCEVAKPPCRPDVAACHAWLTQHLGKIGKAEWADRFALRSAAERLESDPKGGVWFLDLGSNVLNDLFHNPVAKERKTQLRRGPRSGHVVELDLPRSLLLWTVTPWKDPWASQEKNLEGLLDMFDAAAKYGGARFESEMRRLHGRVMVAAPWTDGTDTHSLSLLPDCLPGRGQATPAERIQKHLIDPMNAGLRKQHMSRKEASHWLKTVLRSCELADGAPLTPAIEAVLERAMSRSAKRKGERQDECRLSDLVVALRWLLRSRRAEELFQDKDPARNGLSVAVLNHLPFPVPKAIYAIDGWERPDRLRTFCYCPLARGIRHYNCQAIEGPTGVRGHSLSHQTQAFLFC